MIRHNYSGYAVILIFIGTLGLIYHIFRTDVKSIRQKNSLTNIIGRNQEDPELIEYIKTLIHNPSNLPYKIPEPVKEDYSQYNQTQCLKTLFGDRRKGFFVEVGAYDGVVYSNSLYWEKQREWTGLLIEANPIQFARLLDRHRKAYSIGACVSVSTNAEMMRFHKQELIGKLLPQDSTQNDPNDIFVPCFPIYSLLAALGSPTVDFFSLDIEGWEIMALKTIPYGKVDIRTFLVEHTNLPRGYIELTETMTSLGYETKGKCGSDGVYVKKGIP